MVEEKVQEVFEQEKSKNSPMEVITQSEAKELLDCSDSTLRRLRENGKIHGKKVIGRWFYNRQQLMNFINPVTS